MSNDDKSGLQASLAWYRSNHKAVEHYSGQWVALSSDGVLAHGTDLKKVMVDSKNKGCDKPLLYKVPPDGFLALWWSSYA